MIRDTKRMRPRAVRRRAAALGAAASLLAASAHAYTAAGDRLFPATILLPQIAPSDDAYFTTSTLLDHSKALPSSDDRLTDFSAVYNKTLTENLSIGIEGGWSRLDPAGAGTRSGWQNIDTTVKYLMVENDAHEFLMSAGIDREWGDTGAKGIGASRRGATTPAFFFGKGMGDLGVDFLRPVAIVGTLGYQIADASPRPDLVTTGLALEYSMPYLESKVRALALPAVVRAMTPMVELVFSTPAGNTHGATTTAFVAPGVNYAGRGWEFGLEALFPATRASGTGIGVTAQLHFALDYLFANSIGRPLFGAP